MHPLSSSQNRQRNVLHSLLFGFEMYFVTLPFRDYVDATEPSGRKEPVDTIRTLSHSSRAEEGQVGSR
jgi:hypothetical protein